MAVQAIPEGFHSVTPGCNIVGADKAIEFYKKAFGAEVRVRHATPEGKVMHCEVMIGNSIIMVGEAIKDPVHTLQAMLYVKDSDAVFAKAVEAGATVKMPMADMPWGDRAGRVIDPFGNSWFISTHKEDVADEEIVRRMKAAQKG